MFNLFGKKKSESNNMQYKFEAPENTACIVCDHVLNNERPILYASHDSDGDWQFLCGHDDHSEENAKVISLKEATELDQSINDLYEMPENFGAERENANDNWKPFKMQD